MASSAVIFVISPISMSLVTINRPKISALASSHDVFSVPITASTLSLVLMVCLTPSPCATSWKVTFQKNASKLRYFCCSGVTISCPIGIRILSNFAFMEFLSCKRRVPFNACTLSSFGRLIAIVLLPALQSPA